MGRIPLQVTYIGGPTALLEFGGVRLLTDPTFDPPGGDYTTGPVTLSKTAGPACPAESLDFEIVLLSHDHHFDNLDHLGRQALQRAKMVLTTTDAASRLGGNAVALEPWSSIQIHARAGRTLRITATPARHGPEGMDRGPVVGFILESPEAEDSAVYVSGDTVWYEGVAEIAQRADIDRALLFLGAAQVPAVGPVHLTLTAADAIEFARAYPNAALIPLHFEGWKHFTESRREISDAFAAAGLQHRLHWLEPGQRVEFG